MGNIFSGLEKFGLKLSNVEVYEDSNKQEEKKEAEGGSGKEAYKSKLTEVDILFDKSHTCPVCDREFKSKTVKTGKAQLISADTDLRPKYHILDSLKYDAIVCPYCGYAALNRFFNYITSVQARLIREQISSNFKGINTDIEIYSYDEAIARHKIALLNTIVKRAKLSERAYTCLKLSWLLRGKAESLPPDTKDFEIVKKELAEQELDLIMNAYDGFSQAFSKELFPMCGMDEWTATYLVAELARRCGKNTEAARLLSKVLVSKSANERIKAKAREVKELMKGKE